MCGFDSYIAVTQNCRQQQDCVGDAQSISCRKSISTNKKAVMIFPRTGTRHERLRTGLQTGARECCELVLIHTQMRAADYFVKERLCVDWNGVAAYERPPSNAQ